MQCCFLHLNALPVRICTQIPQEGGRKRKRKLAIPPVRRNDAAHVASARAVSTCRLVSGAVQVILPVHTDSKQEIEQMKTGGYLCSGRSDGSTGSSCDERSRLCRRTLRPVRKNKAMPMDRSEDVPPIRPLQWLQCCFLHLSHEQTVGRKRGRYFHSSNYTYQSIDRT
jgi:hypothetical protein